MGAHLEHAVAEVDVRGDRELAVAVPRELVTRTVDPEIVVVITQAVGVREQEDQGLEQAEAELIRVLHHDAAVLPPELPRDNQEVVTLLRLTDLLHGGSLGGGLAQVLLGQLALAIDGIVVHGVFTVHLAHLVEHLLAGLDVGLAKLTPVEQDEVPLGALRERLAGEPFAVEGTSELGE